MKKAALLAYKKSYKFLVAYISAMTTCSQPNNTIDSVPQHHSLPLPQVVFWNQADPDTAPINNKAVAKDLKRWWRRFCGNCHGLKDFWSSLLLLWAMQSHCILQQGLSVNVLTGNRVTNSIVTTRVKVQEEAAVKCTKAPRLETFARTVNTLPLAYRK